jgi:hypothetical protein
MTAAVLAESNFLPMGTVVIFLAVGAVLTALWLWSLVDALRISDQRWSTAGQSKLLWVLLIVVLGVVGSVLYVAIPRPALGRLRA